MLRNTFTILSLFAFTVNAFTQSLPRYSSILNRVNLETWVQDSARQFDAEGVLLSDGYYHPVNICRYGLMTLELYHETKDAEWLQKSKNQVAYFLDSNRINVLFDGKGIGLPYNFEYKGLMPPWHSGMAQGLAASFLLRFAEIEKDSSLDELVPKLIYTMLQPQELGGCLSRTAENLLWIEEYPNATQSPQVLNGAIFALFGLMDYCRVFPEDKRAKQVLSECIFGLKTALPYYDSQNWTKYNRRTVYPNRFDYIHLQVFQMWQLYEYLNDPFFLRQACIWSAMIFDKTDQSESKHNLFTKMNVSIPGELIETEIRFELEKNNYSEREQYLIEGNFVCRFPKYVFATGEPLKVDSKKMLNVMVDSTCNEVHLFYKYHWDESLFSQEKWQAANAVSENEHQFYLQPGYYEFAVFATPNDKLEIPIWKFHLSDWVE